MERNAEMFRQVADLIEMMPEKHDQRTWCGTSQCVAGWSIFLSGRYRFTYYETGSVSSVIDLETDALVSIDYGNEGEEILGLEPEESAILFAGEAAPVEGLTWPEALRRIANGAEVSEVIC